MFKKREVRFENQQLSGYFMDNFRDDFGNNFWYNFWVQFQDNFGQNFETILGIILQYFLIIAQPISSFSKFQTNLPRFHRQDRLLKLHPNLALAFFDFCQWTWKKWKISFFIINFLP